MLKPQSRGLQPGTEAPPPWDEGWLGLWPADPGAAQGMAQRKAGPTPKLSALLIPSRGSGSARGGGCGRNRHSQGQAGVRLGEKDVQSCHGQTWGVCTTWGCPLIWPVTVHVTPGTSPVDILGGGGHLDQESPFASVRSSPLSDPWLSNCAEVRTFPRRRKDPVGGAPARPLSQLVSEWHLV